MKKRFSITIVALAMILATSIAVKPQTAYSVSDLIPNLKPFAAFQLHTSTDTSGKRWLRFSTESWNNGSGPLELRAGDVVLVGPDLKQKVYQRIYRSDNTYYDTLAGFFTYHPEHQHFHFDDYALYTLQPVNAPGASDRIGSKISFCIEDIDRVNTKLPGAPKKAIYKRCDAVMQGISVGWGDIYNYTLPGQAIDITGLPDGDYNLKIEIDPKNELTEADNSDNISNLPLHLSGGNITIP